MLILIFGMIWLNIYLSKYKDDNFFKYLCHILNIIFAFVLVYYIDPTYYSKNNMFIILFNTLQYYVIPLGLSAIIAYLFVGFYYEHNNSRYPDEMICEIKFMTLKVIVIPFMLIFAYILLK